MNRPTLAAPSPPLARLVLELGHPAGLAEAGQALEHPAELGVRGHLALDEDRGPGRVDPHRDQLGRGPQGPLAEQLRVLLEGDRVQVGDEEERLVVLLEVHPLPERAEVVAEVERVGGRLDAGEHAWSRGLGARRRCGHLGRGGGGHAAHSVRVRQVDRNRPQLGRAAVRYSGDPFPDPARKPCPTSCRPEPGPPRTAPVPAVPARRRTAPTTVRRTCRCPRHRRARPPGSRRPRSCWVACGSSSRWGASSPCGRPWTSTPAPRPSAWTRGTSGRRTTP